MMMSKPTSSEENQEEAPAFAMAPPPTALNVGSVADLERRLAEMGTKKEATPAPAPPPAPVVAKPAAPAPATTAAATSVKGGKNALLARIMAAKEKQEKKGAAPPPPPPAPVAPPAPSDLLMDFDAPSTQMELPPPSYETNFLKDVPPPAFDVMEQQQQQQQQRQQQQHHHHQQQQQQFPPPPPIESVLPPPPPLNDVLPPPPMPEGDLLNIGLPSAPTASAPMFEDLHTQQELHPPPLPPPMEAAAPAAPDIDDSILNALDPAEREAFLEEQRKILEQIEKEKSNNEASGAAARAMAFDQRSSSAVANVAASYERGGASRSQPSSSSSRSSNRKVDLGGGTEVAVHGSETTQKAIDNGTAVIVKCMSCDNWMQVTEAAELMFCPICQVVCPVEKKGAATTADMEAAAQLAADAELAEKLQKEEYANAGGRRANRTRSSSNRTQQQQQQQQQAEGQSWLDWLTGAPAPAATSATRSSPSRPTASASASSAAPSGSRGLVTAQTGEEGRSYGNGGGGGARIAEPKSMFSCVADSMGSAVTQMYTLSADEEGNVHGVDSQGLLAMPDVSRQREH